MAEVKEFELKISTKQAQENVDELNKSLEAQVDLIDEIEKELSSYEKKLTKTSKTNLAARKSLNDKIQQTKEKLKEEKVGLKDVTNERNKSNETLKEATKNSADYSGVLGMIDSKTGGLISGLTGMTKSIGGATKGFNLMKVAIIGTGIGALLIGILAVSKAFTSSEEGQNKFAKIMAVIGSVTGNLVTMLSDLGMMIIGVFENPKQALIDFKDAFIENITNRISSAIETIGFLGSAIKKVFSGDFSGAMEDAKSAGSSYVDTLTGVKGTIDKVSESVSNLANEIVNEGKIAADIADKRANADKLDRKLTVERAEANRKRAELLDKAAQKETFTAQERIAFLKEAGAIEDEITAKEIQAAQLRYDAKVAENALANSTKEDLNEEANLQAELINLQTAKLRKAKAVSSQILGAKREEAAAILAADNEVAANKKAIDDAEIKRLKELAGLRRKIESETAYFEDEKRALELKKIAEHYDALYQAALTDGENSQSLQDILNTKERVLADKKAEHLKKDADKEVKIEKDKADQKNAIQAAQINMVSQGIALLKQVAGKNKALQAAAIIGESAVGIAKTVISTQAANAGALATPQAILTSGASAIPVIVANKINAGIGIASNIAATRKALQGLKAGGSPPPPANIRGASGITDSAQGTLPEFNAVGASGSNQLADAIGSQTKKPVRTYVVASDVTTAQALDRGIITGATVG